MISFDQSEMKKTALLFCRDKQRTFNLKEESKRFLIFITNGLLFVQKLQRIFYIKLNKIHIRFQKLSSNTLNYFFIIITSQYFKGGVGRGGGGSGRFGMAKND